MTLLFDTNVVLDVLLRRAPHVEDAARLYDAVVRGRARGLVAATAVTTAHYFVAKAYGPAQALADVATTLAVFDVAPVTRTVLDAALAAPLGDFEDAVVYHAGVLVGATGVVTRDPAGFVGAALPVYTPAEALAALATP